MTQNNEELASNILKELTGKTLEDAQLLAIKKGLLHRVIMVDGKPYGATDDIKPFRLNFTVENNIVTKITLG